LCIAGKPFIRECIMNPKLMWHIAEGVGAALVIIARYMGKAR
jgi:hypothetical protein